MEMTPLLDVVFLLLTFFIFALVLMVRADVLGISLPRLGSAASASGSETITVALDAAGVVYVDGRAVALEGVTARIDALRQERPEARLFVAVDQNGRSRDLLRLIDTMVGDGITDFSLLGRPGREPGDGPATDEKTGTEADASAPVGG